MYAHAAAHHAQQIQALKAVASLIEVDEATFRLLLRSNERPTVVVGHTKILWFKKNVYLTSYDGFVFIHRAAVEIDVRAEAPQAFIVQAEHLHIPSV